MPSVERIYDQDLNQAVEIRHGGGIVFTGDAYSLKVTVRLTRNGINEVVDGSCIVRVILSDGVTVVVDGDEPSGNEISATLPDWMTIVPDTLSNLEGFVVIDIWGRG